MSIVRRWWCPGTAHGFEWKVPLQAKDGPLMHDPTDPQVTSPAGVSNRSTRGAPLGPLDVAKTSATPFRVSLWGIAFR